MRNQGAYEICDDFTGKLLALFLLHARRLPDSGPIQLRNIA